MLAGYSFRILQQEDACSVKVLSAVVHTQNNGDCLESSDVLHSTGIWNMNPTGNRSKVQNVNVRTYKINTLSNNDPFLSLWMHVLVGYSFHSL